MRKLKLILCITFVFVIALPFLGWYSYRGSASGSVLETENRILTPYRELVSLRKSDVKQYFRNFDLYISDRLMFKDFVVETVLNSVRNPKYFFDVDLTKGVIGEGGFVFLGNDYDRVLDRHFSTGYSIDDQDLRKLLLKHEKLAEKSMEVGAEYFIFVAPDKHTVYCEELPEWVRGVTCNQVYKVTNQVSKAMNERGIKVIYPYKKLKEHKKEGVYFKTDTHWNVLGAKYGFDFLFERLCKDEKLCFVDAGNGVVKYDLKKVPNSAFGDLGKIVGLGKDFVVKDVKYELLSDCKVQWSEGGESPEEKYVQDIVVKGFSSKWYGNSINEKAKNKKKVLVICDSFMTAMSYFFSLNFEEVNYISRHFQVDELSDFLEKTNPDIVIYETVERAYK